MLDVRGKTPRHTTCSSSNGWDWAMGGPNIISRGLAAPGRYRPTLDNIKVLLNI